MEEEGTQTNGKPPASIQRVSASPSPIAAPPSSLPRAASVPNFAIDNWDVYLGRGSYNAWRPGNAKLHRLVGRFMKEYDGAVNRKTKTSIIQNIYDEISSQGRFLFKDKETKQYQEVSEDFAKKKIGHAFRDKRRKCRQTSTKAQKEAKASDTTLDEVEGSRPPPNEAAPLKLPPIPQGRNPPPPPAVHPPPPPPAMPDQVPHPYPSVAASRRERTEEEGEGEGNTSSSSSMFSDGELLSVLGTQNEYRD